MGRSFHHGDGPVNNFPDGLFAEGFYKTLAG
jgi:hypothetical protein